MALDPYDLCPCGSGKKLKFCCQAILGEMEKVGRLQQNHQFKMALQTLEALQKDHPKNSWVHTTRAAILLDDGRPAEAVDVLKSFLEIEPDHQFAIALMAVASFSAYGYDEAKSAIHRAFERSVQHAADVLAGVALGVAGVMLGRGRSMAARQFLTLAMRLSPPDDQQSVFLRLLELDSDESVPYPLRSVHDMADCTDIANADTELKKAIWLANLGSGSAAANVLEKLAESHPQHAGLRKNIALCRAWDGDEAAAALAFREASRLQSDFSLAVEWETLAQLLELNADENRVHLLQEKFNVPRASALLTKLDDADRFVRIPVPQNGEQEQLPSAVYYLVDKPLLDEEAEPDDITPDNIPEMIGQVMIFPPDTDGESDVAHVLGFEGTPLATSVELFREAAGDLATPGELPEEEKNLRQKSIPREFQPLTRQLMFPRRTQVKKRQQVIEAHQNEFLNETWPSTPLAALGNQTPNDATGNEELKIPLTAAAYVLDAYCNQYDLNVDLEAVLSQLQLERLPLRDVSEDEKFNHLSAMQIRRLPLAKLSDEQLVYVLNRAHMLQHGQFLYDVLCEVESRPTCRDRVDFERVYSTLVDICSERFDHEESLKWVAKGRENAKTAENAFESSLQWAMKELGVRLEDHDDPGLTPLLSHLWDYYGAKLPEMRPTLQRIVETTGIEAPWDSGGIVTAATAGSTAATEGIWTPSGEGQTAGESGEAPGKLWLPGQD